MLIILLDIIDDFANSSAGRQSIKSMSFGLFSIRSLSSWQLMNRLGPPAIVRSLSPWSLSLSSFLDFELISSTGNFAAYLFMEQIILWKNHRSAEWNASNKMLTVVSSSLSVALIGPCSEWEHRLSPVQGVAPLSSFDQNLVDSAPY